MKRCRILYLTKIHFDSHRTHVYNIVRTCEALNNIEDVNASLVSTDAVPDVEGLFSRHHVDKPFEIFGLGISFSGDVGRVRYALWLLRINISLALFLIKHKKNYDVIYTRDESLLISTVVGRLLGKKLFFETHSVLVGAHRQFLNTSIIRLSSGVIAISKRLREYYEPLNENILVSYCGADESFWLDTQKSKQELRDELGLPKNPFIVGYTGVVGENPNGDYYEIDHVIQSLALLPEYIVFIVVGEQEGNADWLRDVIKSENLEERVFILPWQDRSVIPGFLLSFDVVVVPRRKKDLASDSPLKMFSALSAGRPIVGGKSVAITEILKDKVNAVIVSENTPHGWAKAINTLYEDQNLADQIAKKAKNDSKQYTWGRRGEDIFSFIQKNV